MFGLKEKLSAEVKVRLTKFRLLLQFISMLRAVQNTEIKTYSCLKNYLRIVLCEPEVPLQMKNQKKTKDLHF